MGLFLLFQKARVDLNAPNTKGQGRNAKYAELAAQCSKRQKKKRAHWGLGPKTKEAIGH